MRQRVLIVSARMGAGHDGAARELRRRLVAQGHAVEIVDFLQALRFHLGPILRRAYQLQIRYLPNSYERTYKLWFKLPWLWKPFVFLETALAGGRVKRWVDAYQPDVVVSVYPFSSLVLGELRRRRKVRAPVITFLTDFAVHPRWVHPGVDLHLCVHAQVAAAAMARSGGPALAPGPLVGPAFTGELPPRGDARRRLGIGADERVALVVAGSWAVGDVEDTVETVCATGRYTPVILCGSDDALKRRFEERGQGHPVGWTSEVPSYLAAADVLVENAGGLSFLEACAAGVPVITYNPIAGHGRDNAAAMARAGVARVPETPEAFVAALDTLSQPGPQRTAQIVRSRQMFRGDAAAEVVAVAEEARHRARVGAGVGGPVPGRAPWADDDRPPVRVPALAATGSWALGASAVLLMVNSLADAASRWLP